MMLHLDQFGEGEPFLHLPLEVAAESAAELLDGTGYQVASTLSADFHINRVGNTLRVRGPVAVAVSFECGRCLRSATQAVKLDAEFVLIEKAEWAAKYEVKGEFELEGEDMDVDFYEGESVDLAPFVREAILLELPLIGRCAEAEIEACDAAYSKLLANVSTLPPQKQQVSNDDTADPRWAALQNIKLKD